MELMFSDSYGNQIDHLTQWDTDQTLFVRTNRFFSPPVFHFCNIRSEEALVVESSLNNAKDEISVKIPNSLLQEPYPIFAFIYEYTSDTSGKSVSEIRINVHKRPKPSEYEYVDNIDKVSTATIKADLRKEIEEKTAEVLKIIKETNSKHESDVKALQESDESLADGTSIKAGAIKESHLSSDLSDRINDTVQYKAAQSLTSEEKSTARDNIDAAQKTHTHNNASKSSNGFMSSGDKTKVDSSVLFTSQTLSSAQKSQARANIGAGTSSFSGSYKNLSDVPDTFAPSDHSHEMDDVSGLNNTVSSINDALNNINITLGNINTDLSSKSDDSHIHSDATTSASGFMSSDDKAKLDSSVLFTSQALDDTQMMQARNNINARADDRIIAAVNASKFSSIEIAPHSSGLIAVTGSSSTNSKGLWFFYSSSGGVILSEIVSPASASVSASTITTRKIKMSNTSGAPRYFVVCFFYGSGSFSDDNISNDQINTY